MEWYPEGLEMGPSVVECCTRHQTLSPETCAQIRETESTRPFHFLCAILVHMTSSYARFARDGRELCLLSQRWDVSCQNHDFDMNFIKKAAITLPVTSMLQVHHLTVLKAHCVRNRYALNLRTSGNQQIYSTTDST